MNVLRIVAVLLLAACAQSACSFAPDPMVPEPVAQVPDRFSRGIPEGITGNRNESREWWKAFSDPVLNAVVDSVLVSNFDLVEAVARVRQARAQARIVRAALFPSVLASGSVAEQNTPANAGFGAQFQALGLGRGQGDSASVVPSLDRLALTTVSVSADISYELDFWGRAGNEARSAGSEYLASESDFHAARIGVLAETITTYFEIVALRRRVVLVRETVDVLVEREALAQTRYDRGLAPSLELYQVRGDLRNTQAALPRIETGLADAEGRLAVLLGGYRRNVEAILSDSLAPVLPADPVPTGIPADLLLQRPDVRAAGQRLEAARYGIGARRAELFPSLSFSGSIGLQSSQVDGLFNVDQWFRNLVANLTGPVFQGGRLRNNVALALARFDQAAAAYGRTVVTAVHEVEAALAGLDSEGRRHAFLAAQQEEARASADLQARRYTLGVGGYSDYLDALRTLLNVESALADATRDVALARLAVHRALGGDWITPKGSPMEARPSTVPIEAPPENRPAPPK